MCKAFSCIVTEDCHAKWKFGMDSHEAIIDEFKLKDDGHNFARVEVSPANGSYLNPDEWVFRLDEQAKPRWWTTAHEAEARDAQKDWQKKLDKILVHKPIVHPFKDIVPPEKITKRHLDLLRQWDSVRASVWDSVRASVGDSVWASVRDSVRASVWAYIGSFCVLPRSAWKYTTNIKLPKGQAYPFQAAVNLWMMGLVPSFDGNVWRLHGGKGRKVLWEGGIK
jgi:hypothetical protein